MAEAVVSITKQIIRDLLVEEANFLWGVSDEVKKIEGELVRMKCFLKDADAKQHTDERVRNWVREIKELCYEIEDVVETFVVEVASRKGEGLKNLVERIFCCLADVVNRIPCSPSECIALHEVGAKIERIKAHIIDLTESLERYGVNKSMDAESSKEAEENERRLRQTYAHEDEVDFVGMQDEIEQLVQLMIDDSNKAHKVITIFGMGGLGKTTLAKKVYNRPEVQRCFEASAWACVTKKIQFKVVLQDVLKQLLGDHQEAKRVKDMDEDELVRKLYQVQKEKECMVVLDDVWEINHWIMLKKAFPVRDQAANSKLLLTTRKEEVAERGRLYQLRYLTEDEGWHLLRKKAFPGQEEKDIKMDPKLEAVGREIVRKCGRLPLAISLLGGILKSRSLIDWQMVHQDIDSYLSEETGGWIENVLALSYNDLPYNLKSCFLYMGILREDEEIKARKLYHLWIAEGMISGKGSMMDVAERNLKELASRSMVQVQIDNTSTRIESCKLHDLMRDLCLKKAKEEGLLETFDMNVGGDISSFSNIANARRLAVYVGKDKKLLFRWDQITNQSLRTLALRDAEVQGEPKFKLCRVLVLENCGSKLLEQMSKMVHLRYLNLRDCRFDELPSSIGDLPYTETLDLRTRSIIYIPHNIFSKMKQLRHLYLGSFHCGGSEKLRLNGLRKLESLEGFDDELCWNRDLSELVELRYFSASLKRRGDDLSLVIDHVDSWRKIKWVKISMTGVALSRADIGKILICRNLSDLVLEDIRIGKLPKYESQFWPNLMSLVLSASEFEEDSMEFLKKLPNLRELNLRSDSFVGKEISVKAADFPQLRSLGLTNLFKVKKLRVDKGALPNLSSLIIYSWQNLEIVPADACRYLTNLKRLVIHQPSFRAALITYVSALKFADAIKAAGLKD